MTGARINIHTYINIKHRVRITTSTNMSSGNPNNNNGHTNSCNNIVRSLVIQHLFWNDNRDK